MPVLQNPRHERFAQELAKGKPADAAYKLAGYAPNDGNCIRLKGNERVAARVAEILGKAAAKVEVTAADIARQLDEDRALAQEVKAPSAAVSASMGKAKVLGLIQEKHHHSGVLGTYDITKLSDDQLDRLEAILGPLAIAGGDPGGEAAPAALEGPSKA